MSSKNSWSSKTDKLEENLIALFMGLMTVITFANVVARYVFNSNILWALEATVFLFAWLVLIGVSYGVKKSIHLGVDVLLNIVSPPVRRLMTIIAVLCCLLFSVLLLKGSWDYWSPFVGKRAFLETEDIPMPEILQFFSTWLNEGERYEKLPRFIPYFALPLGLTLLTIRYLQLTWQVFRGEVDLLIASHEVQDEQQSADEELEIAERGGQK